IHPEQAKARDNGTVRNSQRTRSAGSVEVELVVADEVSAFPVAIHTQAETRILLAEMEFREVAVRDVVIGHAAEVRTHTGRGVLVAPEGREIHEPDRNDAGIAKAEVWRNGAVRAGFARIFRRGR